MAKSQTQTLLTLYSHFYHTIALHLN